MGVSQSVVLAPSEDVWAILVSELDERCEAVASALASADVLLLCTGAGFSADSGLAVYKDVADIEAYREVGFGYRDLCRQSLLYRDPELFYGFWGSCFNDYRRTQPHDGYNILRRWKDERFSTSPVANDIRSRLQNKFRTIFGQTFGANGQQLKLISSHDSEPHPIKGCAGAFFVCTSNVDAHSYDFFKANEVREVHGNTEVWQCGAQREPCCGRTWRAPSAFSFNVDKQTMRVFSGSSDSVRGTNVSDSSSKGTKPSRRNLGAELSAATHAFLEVARKASRSRSRSHSEASEGLANSATIAGPDSQTSNEVEASAVGDVMPDSNSELIPPALISTDMSTTGADDITSIHTLASPLVQGVNVDVPNGVVDTAVGVKNPPRVGQVLPTFGLRRSPLANFPLPDVDMTSKFTGGGEWPHCVHCRGLARPAVLMFDDQDWIQNEAQDARCKAWFESVSEAAKAMVPSGRRLRVAILEIGCGGTVRTCRNITERAAKGLSESEAQVSVARINVGFPLADSQVDSESYEHISILSGGLEALRRIDAALSRLDKCSEPSLHDTPSSPPQAEKCQTQGGDAKLESPRLSEEGHGSALVNSECQLVRRFTQPLLPCSPPSLRKQCKQKRCFSPYIASTRQSSETSSTSVGQSSQTSPSKTQDEPVTAVRPRQLFKASVRVGVRSLPEDAPAGHVAHTMMVRPEHRVRRPHQAEHSALPEDAPAGHVAHTMVKKDKHHRCHPSFFFFHNGKRFQTTARAAGSFRAAQVTARACWMKFEQGWSKRQVLNFRAECYAGCRSAAKPEATLEELDKGKGMDVVAAEANSLTVPVPHILRKWGRGSHFAATPQESSTDRSALAQRCKSLAASLANENGEAALDSKAAQRVLRNLAKELGIRLRHGRDRLSPFKMRWQLESQCLAVIRQQTCKLMQEHMGREMPKCPLEARVESATTEALSDGKELQALGVGIHVACRDVASPAKSPFPSHVVSAQSCSQDHTMQAPDSTCLVSSQIVNRVLVFRKRVPAQDDSSSVRLSRSLLERADIPSGVPLAPGRRITQKTSAGSTVYGSKSEFVTRSGVPSASGRRIIQKMSAGSTVYGSKPEFVTRSEAKSLKKKKAFHATSVQKARIRGTKRTAYGTAICNIESVRSISDRHGGGEHSTIDESAAHQAHKSHALAVVGKTQSIYCTKCGSWYTSGKMRGLALKCPNEVSKARPANYRLLQLGIVPQRGVRIPRRHRRKK